MGDLAVVLTAKADRDNGFPSPVIEDITNRIFDLRFSTTLPGGFLTCSFSLLFPRWKAFEWYERFAFYGIDIYEADEHIWQGRIQEISIQEFGVTINCDGYWASMADQQLHAFWADNDMNNWSVPTAGASDFAAAGIQSEINLIGLGQGTKKISIRKSTNLIAFFVEKDIAYLAGEIAAVYYRLPRVGDLLDNRIFTPNTIHSIAYTFDRGSVLLSTQMDCGIWTADHARGEWTNRINLDDLTGNGVPKFSNLAQDGVRIEAVAVALQVQTNFTQGDDNRVYFFNNITVFSERDATLDKARKSTSKKIFTDLLKGNTDILTPTHAKQISADTIFVEDSDADIIPARFENKTFQDIITETHNFGLVDNLNLMHAPMPELLRTVDQEGWPALRTADVPDARFGKFSSFLQVLSGGALTEFVHTDVIGATPFKAAYKPIEAGDTYIISAYMKLASGTKNVTLGLQWRDGDEGLLSTSTSGNKSVNTTWTRFDFNVVAPANTKGARIQVNGVSGQGTWILFIAAIQLEKAIGSITTPSEFLHGDMEGVAWGGRPWDSATIKTTPVIAGVYGRNRFIAKRRDETAVKWIIPLKEVQEGGIELQKSAMEFWGRAWTRYQEGLTGLTKFASALPENVEQYYDSFQKNTAANYDTHATVDGTWTFSQEPTESKLRGNGGTTSFRAVKISLFGDVADVEVECEIDESQSGGIAARLVDEDTYYLLRFNDDSGVTPTINIQLAKEVAGVFTSLDVANLVWARNDLVYFKLRVVGDKLEGYFNGDLVVSVTDSAITAAGQVAMRSDGAGNNDYFTFRATEIVTVNNSLAEELFHDERDIIMDAGQTLEGFARLIAQVQLTDSDRPKQSSQLVINGSIMNNLGAREALWRVRAGDVIMIPDLVPFPQSVKQVVSQRILDKLRIFVVKDTEYDASNNELKLTPDAPPPELDLLLSRAAGAPSVAPVGGIGGVGGTGSFSGTLG